MSTIWKKLKDKRYREEYATAMLKRMIPYQVRAIRKKRGWSQAQLAEAAQVTQGVISRAEDPDYGNLTLTTIGRIAAGYDLAAIIRLVPFSELVRYSENTSEREFAESPTFVDQDSTEKKPMHGLRFSGLGGMQGEQIDDDTLGMASGPFPKGNGKAGEIPYV
jgi:transcriptional regulator with XRE-family HTH domain